MVERIFRDGLIAALNREAGEGGIDVAMAALKGGPLWVIVNTDQEGETLFWSNDQGFVDADFDFFTQDEKEAFNLPMGGRWETVATAIGLMAASTAPDAVPHQPRL